MPRWQSMLCKDLITYLHQLVSYKSWKNGHRHLIMKVRITQFDSQICLSLQVFRTESARIFQIKGSFYTIENSSISSATFMS